MGAIVLFLGKHWQLVVAGLLIAALAASGIYIKILKAEKGKLRAEKITLSTELSESQANIKQLSNDIQVQNLAVDKLKADADSRIAIHAADIAHAKSVSDGYKKQAQTLLSRPAPPNIPTCTAADRLINEELQNANK